MAPRIYPGSTPGPTDGSGPAGEGANAPEHRTGADVDSGDQVSSMVLLGLALAGAIVSTGVFMLIG